MKLDRQQPSHAGPPLLLLALVHLGLFIAALVLGPMSRAPGFGNPYGPAEAAREFFANNPEAIRVGAFFFFGSAILLGLFTATIVSRLRFLGVRAAGSYIALYGGLAAASALSISPLSSWVLSVPEVSSSLAATRVLHFLTFLFGGVGFAAGFGILAAGVSVTSYFMRLLPRWLVWFGLVIAAAGELSTLSLIAYPATLAIPITRFGGFIWMIAVGISLPRTIHQDTTP